MKKWRELKIWQKCLIVLAALPVLASFYPLDRSNPPVTAGLQAPADVDDVLRRACYDCHSNETYWPWYSYVAPVSFLVTQDVELGRDEMNFSDWGNMDPIDRVYLREECWEQVEAGKMPPLQYRGRGRSKLTDEDRAIIESWAEDAMDEEEEPESDE